MRYYWHELVAYSRPFFAYIFLAHLRVHSASGFLFCNAGCQVQYGINDVIVMNFRTAGLESRCRCGMFFWKQRTRIFTDGRSNSSFITRERTSRQCTVKGQSRSDSLLLSPYHWAKLFRGVVAIVAVPMRFAVIC